MHDVASLGAILRDDGSLGTAVNEGLHWHLVDGDIDVQHANRTEELRELLLSCHVVLLDHILANLLLDQLLCLEVVGVGIFQFGLSLLLLLLGLHLSLELVMDQLLERLLVT